LYYFKGNKERHFYLPRFKNNPGYREEILALQKRVESLHPTVEKEISTGEGWAKAKNEKFQQRAKGYSGRPIFIQRFINLLDGFVLVGIIGISAWITSNLPPGGVDAFEVGFTIGFFFSWFGLLGMFPVIGQILFWFIGRWLIGAISGFLFQLSPDKIFWDTPGPINRILSQFNIKPIHASFTDFLFWSILLFSVLISLDNAIGSLRRRALKRQIKA
jgi:hypothetical protein